MDWNGTWFVGGVDDFVDDVLFEAFKVQLFLPAGVEGEPRTLHSTFPSLVR